MGPPPRSFAADAHDCIMVAILADRPNTSLWRELRAQWRAPLGSSLTAAGCRCARDRQGLSRFAMAVRPPLTVTARSCDVPFRSGRRDVAAVEQRDGRLKSLRDGRAATLDRHCAQLRCAVQVGTKRCRRGRTKRWETQECGLTLIARYKCFGAFRTP